MRCAGARPSTSAVQLRSSAEPQERLVTDHLDEVLRTLDATRLSIERGSLDPEDAHRVLARHIAAMLDVLLAALPGEPQERLTRQIELVNALVDALHHRLGTTHWIGREHVSRAGEELLAIVHNDGLPTPPRAPECPGIPLTTSALLVNARGEHRVGHELQRELESADAVDLVCAFIRWYGLRLLEPQLRRLLDTGGCSTGSGVGGAKNGRTRKTEPRSRRDHGRRRGR